VGSRPSMVEIVVPRSSACVMGPRWASPGGPARFQVLPEKCQRPLERELGGVPPPAVARGLGEPVTGPRVAVDDDAAPGLPERALESEHRLIGLVRVGLREMAEYRCRCPLEARTLQRA